MNREQMAAAEAQYDRDRQRGLTQTAGGEKIARERAHEAANKTKTGK